MNIDIIGVPLDMGQGRRGVDMGPSAIRYAELKSQLEAVGCEVEDLGNLQVPVPEECEEKDSNLRYLNCIVSVARDLADKVESSVAAERVPLVLGGDHSVSLGSVHGAARSKKLGLIWIDAHGDFNDTETTPSGNIHGMPLAALAGYGDQRLVTIGDEIERAVDPINVAIIGVRDLDPGERELLREARVTVFATEQIDRIGLYAALSQAIEVATNGTDGVYLSLDLDAIDPVEAPGVGTPVPGGLTYREAHLACELIAESGQLLGMDVVEVNPILDQRNRTAILAVELTLSALGKRVWKNPIT